jgi:hypothetical protein
MWHEFDAIIVQCLVGKKNLYFLIILLAQWLIFEIIFSYIIFKGRKQMQWLSSFYNLEVLGSNPFFEFFSSLNKMDENKLFLGNFLKLVIQEQFLQRESCSWKKKKKGFKLFIGEQLCSQEIKGLSYI